MNICIKNYQNINKLVGNRLNPKTLHNSPNYATMTSKKHINGNKCQYWHKKRLLLQFPCFRQVLHRAIGNDNINPKELISAHTFVKYLENLVRRTHDGINSEFRFIFHDCTNNDWLLSRQSRFGINSAFR